MSPLSAADLRFINRVVAARFGAGPTEVDDAALAAAVEAVPDGTPQRRAAVLAAELLARRVFASEPRRTVLIALHCALGVEDIGLLAPQGVLAGMVASLERGEVDLVTRWLDDRSVPRSSGG